MDMPALVTFDLDGTLVDSAPDLSLAVDRTLAELQLPPPGEPRVRAWVGLGSRHLLTQALHWAGVPAPAHAADREFERFMQHYGECLCLRTRLYPQAAELLTELRARGARLALCTNKPHRFVEPLLRWLDIAEHFHGWLGGDALPRRKPHAEPLLWLARQAGVAPAQALMVGDSQTDILAARAAGMPVVVMRHGYPGEGVLDGADGVLAGFGELLPWIDRQRERLWPESACAGAAT